MKIDYLTNPNGIIKTFFIPYGSDENEHFYLEARIEGITEEGFDKVGWFDVRVGYPSQVEGRFSELSENILNSYKKLRERSVPSLDEAIIKLKNWCAKENFKLFEMLPVISNN